MKAVIRQSGKEDFVQNLSFADAEIVSAKEGVLVMFEDGHDFFDGEKVAHPCRICGESCCTANELCLDCHEVTNRAMTQDEEDDLDDRLFGPGGPMDLISQYGHRGC